MQQNLQKPLIKFCAHLVFTQFFKWLRDTKLFRKLPGMNIAVCHTQQRILSTDLTLCHFNKVHTFTYFLKINFNIILLSTFHSMWFTDVGISCKNFVCNICIPIPQSSLTQMFQITFLSLERSSVGMESNNFKIQTEQTGVDRE